MFFALEGTLIPVLEINAPNKGNLEFKSYFFLFSPYNWETGVKKRVKK